MVNREDNLQIEETIKASSKRQLNTSLLLKIFITIIFFSYLYSLFYGESSIGVLQAAKEREEQLRAEYNKTQHENQQLQKKHFELIQLTPEEDNF